jgi:hypothetical protein
LDISEEPIMRDEEDAPQAVASGERPTAKPGDEDDEQNAVAGRRPATRTRNRCYFKSEGMRCDPSERGPSLVEDCLGFAKYVKEVREERGTDRISQRRENSNATMP